MSDRAVTFVADNPPYRCGETAAFPASRAAAFVTGRVARYAETIVTPAAELVEDLVVAEPQAGKRTTQSTRFARKS